jgi:GABA(A) receptor-associated protein
MSFKNEYTFEERQKQVKDVLIKHPQKIPVICERHEFAPTDCPEIDKKKYLVPMELTVGQFLYVIRNRLKILPNKSIFLFIDGLMPSTSTCLHYYYANYKDSDGFLYINYTFENVFGSNGCN